MEAEQISEWSLKHPGERIIDVDLPLSYGVYDPNRDTNNINCLSFKWDPTRGEFVVEIWIFLGLNSISANSYVIMIDKTYDKIYRQIRKCKGKAFEVVTIYS